MQEQIIDFHTHTFPDKIAASTISSLADKSHTTPFCDGTESGLIHSMEKSGVRYSVNLPVMTSPGQVEKVNQKMIDNRESMLEEGIITFGGIHPDYPDYKRELKKLADNHIPGIKIHPAYQNTDLDDIRFLRIIEYASELGLIVITHAGIDIGLHDHNYASADQILHVIREVSPKKFVLAHMGGWDCWKEVESDLCGAPVWFDTAFSLGKVTYDHNACVKPYITYNLSDEDFVRIVRKHGNDRILFGTDSPWEDQADYIDRIRKLPLSDQEKEQIFSGNAISLLS